MKKIVSIVRLGFYPAILGLVLSVAGCSSGDDSTTPDPVDPPVVVVPPTFPGPTYPDNYTSIASWDSRSQWN